MVNESMTMLCVTHKMGFAQRVADRIVYMDAGQFFEEAPPRGVLHGAQK